MSFLVLIYFKNECYSDFIIKIKHLRSDAIINYDYTFPSLM